MLTLSILQGFFIQYCRNPH